MKSNKEKVYEYVVQKLCSSGTESFTTLEVAEVFNLHRSNASSILNQLVKEHKLKKTLTRPVCYYLSNEEDTKKKFPVIIGDKGSLAKSIQLAKAAMLYPQENLSILICSEIGTGKSAFARSIYQFAQGNAIISDQAPYIEVNCSHYSKDYQSLCELLFGGSELKDSVFFHANGGLLFINHIDMLAVKERSRLISFLETKRLYSEDGQYWLDCQNLRVIMGTSNNEKQEFINVDHMVIDLPSLEERPIEEKYQLISWMLTKEANYSQRKIQLSAQALTSLLSANYPLNLQDLRYVIKTSCAKAYIRVVDSDSPIQVTVDDVTIDHSNQMIRERSYRRNILEIIEHKNSLMYFPIEKAGENLEEQDLYQLIEERYQTYLSQNQSERGEFSETVSDYIQDLFQHYQYFGQREEPNLVELEKIIPKQLIDLVTKIYKKHEKNSQIKMDRNSFYSLCLHLNSLLHKSQTRQKRINNDNIVKIIRDYPDQYGIASELSNELNTTYQLELSIEEIVFITMFFIKFPKVSVFSKPIIVYILHGKQAASSLAETARNLTQANNIFSYDLALTDSYEIAYEEIKNLISNYHQGKGVIVIYDMGSIKTIIDKLALDLQIKIRSIEIPITLLGVEAARKSQMGSDIDSVFHDISLDWQRYTSHEFKEKIIITLCHTGEGGAMQMKNLIEKHSRLGYKVVPLAISDWKELFEEVFSLKKAYDIHCFVGTYDPRMLGIPFISLSKVFDYPLLDLDNILTFSPIGSGKVDFNLIYESLTNDLTYTPIEKIKSVLPDILNRLELIYSLSEDQRIGLFMHLSVMIDQIRAGKRKPFVSTIENQNIIKAFKEDYKLISQITKDVEKEFDILIDDVEMTLLIQILRRV